MTNYIVFLPINRNLLQAIINKDYNGIDRFLQNNLNQDYLFTVNNLLDVITEYVQDDIELIRILINYNLPITNNIIHYYIKISNNRIIKLLLENFKENIPEELINFFITKFIYNHPIIKSFTLKSSRLQNTNQEETDIIINEINDFFDIFDLLLRNNNNDNNDYYYGVLTMSNFNDVALISNGHFNNFYQLFIINYYLLIIYHNKNLNCSCLSKSHQPRSRLYYLKWYYY
jgi:hypothetical protein